MGSMYAQLSAEERGQIMAMLRQGSSCRGIATVLGRATSTIAREVRRNGGAGCLRKPQMGRPRHQHGYDATAASDRAHRLRQRARRPRKLARGGPLWARVHQALQQRWSPAQIAATLRRLHPHEPHLHVSHETIYTAIYAAPRGGLRRELVRLLRQARATRRPRTAGQDRRGQLQQMVSIHVRPPEANERLLPGHWEGDLIKGAGNRSCVGTLVCRRSLFVMLVKLDGASAEQALRGYAQAFGPLDPALRQTLTYDQGKEMALHKVLTQATGLRIYFADPHSPWQRGICENTNGLIRQYLPKGTDLSLHSQRQLDAIAWSLNTRPRKTLAWRTPAEVLFTTCFEQRINVQPLVALGL